MLSCKKHVTVYSREPLGSRHFVFESEWNASLFATVPFCKRKLFRVCMFCLYLGPVVPFGIPVDSKHGPKSKKPTVLVFWPWCNTSALTSQLYYSGLTWLSVSIQMKATSYLKRKPSIIFRKYFSLLIIFFEYWTSGLTPPNNFRYRPAPIYDFILRLLPG